MFIMNLIFLTLFCSMTFSADIYHDLPSALNELYQSNGALSSRFVPYKDQINFENLKTGDIVAISELKVDPFTIFFEAATGSRFGHIGIIVEENGVLNVYESNPPIVQKSPLMGFLGRSSIDNEPLYTILRPKIALTDGEINTLKQTMIEIINKPTFYNKKQIKNESTLNCSEFVFKVFQSINRSIGKIHPMSDLNLNVFKGIFWNLFSTSRSVDINGLVITPYSIVRSPELEVLYTTVPYEKPLSEESLMKAWNKENALELFKQFMIDQFSIPPNSIQSMIAQLNSSPSKIPATDIYDDVMNPLKCGSNFNQ